MNVLNYIKEKRKKGPLHFTLIDPDKQSVERAVEIAKLARDSGSDAIMIGGSQPTTTIYLNETIRAIKKEVDLPIILFPYSHAMISPEADAIFFMSLLNSRTPQYLIEEQIRGSILVKSYNLQPLSMGYIIVESGSTTSAEWGGDAKSIPRERPDFITGYALAAKFFGMKFIYLEAGSGAKLSVPNEMITLVKKTIRDEFGNHEMFIIVGGGIKDEKIALEKINAGADIIVTGTIAEDDTKKLKEIVKSIKNKG